MKGRNGKVEGTGGTDYCVCPECGKKFKHSRGEPCNKSKCPTCGVALTGYNTVGSKLKKALELRKGKKFPEGTIREWRGKKYQKRGGM